MPGALARLSGAPVAGRRRLHALACLAECAGADFEWADFTYHDRAPFSPALAAGTAAAEADGRLNVTAGRGRYGAALFTYADTATATGGRNGVGALDANAARRLVERASRADDATLELAATAAFLARQGVSAELLVDELVLRKGADAAEGLAEAAALLNDLEIDALSGEQASGEGGGLVRRGTGGHGT